GAPRLAQPDIGGRDPVASARAADRPQRQEALPEAEDPGAAVGRAIVDRDQLVTVAAVLSNALKRLADIALAVPDRHHDGEPRIAHRSGLAGDGDELVVLEHHSGETRKRKRVTALDPQAGFAHHGVDLLEIHVLDV